MPAIIGQCPRGIMGQPHVVAHFMSGGFSDDGFITAAIGAGYPGRLIIVRNPKRTDIGDATGAIVRQRHSIFIRRFTDQQPSHIGLVASVVDRIISNIRCHIDVEGRVVLRDPLPYPSHPDLLRIVERRPVRIL